MKVRDMCDDHDEIFNFRIYKRLHNLKPKEKVGLDADAGR